MACMPLSGRCVQCDAEYDISLRIFEQRLIEDWDFCPKCFEEIMTENEEDSLSYIDGLALQTTNL